MPKGYPDWGVVKDSVGVMSQDTAELAVRLGSLYRYSRTGKVLIATNFRDDYALWGVPLFGTYSVQPYLLDGLYIPGCLRWSSTGVINTAGTITRRIPRILNTIFGLEIAVRMVSLSAVDFLTKFSYVDGAREWVFDVYFRPSTDDIMIPDAGATLRVAYHYPGLFGTTASWHLIKMLINIDDKTIPRFMYDGEILPIIDPGRYSFVNAVNGTYLQVGTGFNDVEVSALDLRVGSFVLTFDEESI